MSPESPAEKSKAQSVRDYVAQHPRAKAADVATALAAEQISVTPAYVREVTRKGKARKPRRKKGSAEGASPKKAKGAGPSAAKFPRHTLERVLRIPRAIWDQHAGKECSIAESARFVGLTSASGEYQTEVSSARKYGLLESPRSGGIVLTDLARQILRPQKPEDELDGRRKAILQAPDVSDVYEHYRGEYLPEDKFFGNALVDNFRIPADKLDEFKSIFEENLAYAGLLEEHGDRKRVLDVSGAMPSPSQHEDRLRRLERGADVSPDDSCFVMMPFAEPHNSYYRDIYEPAIKKTGLRPVRADHAIFGTGKIMDQVWDGISSARVLLAELTTKNANVFYELGLAHARHKPVVLVSANEDDVPFDLRHIRVIYYDVNDPFWGQKLIDKVAENILSALKNPEEAIFKQEAE